MRLLARVLALTLLVVSIGFATAAALRPYADNQRNWLVIGACLSALSVLPLAFAGWARFRCSLTGAWCVLRREWSSEP